MSDGDGANGGGPLGADGGLMGLGNTAGPGDRNGSTATTVHGEPKVPWHRGGAGGRVEPDGVRAMGQGGVTGTADGGGAW